MEIIVILFLLTILLISWMISTKRKLAAMNENVCNAMTQIGIQQSSCFDALLMLLDLTKDYSAQEILSLREAVKSRRSFLTALSTPDEAQCQERIIAEAMKQLTEVAERFPTLREHENYRKFTNAVEGYKKMLCTSCLIYNDSVNKFNRTIQTAPTSLIAGILGFHKKEYLELSTGKMSGMNRES